MWKPAGFNFTEELGEQILSSVEIFLRSFHEGGPLVLPFKTIQKCNKEKFII